MRSRFIPMVSACVTALSLTALVSCASPTENGSATQSSEAPASQQIDCSTEKCVALTFDDGPGEFTNQLLDELQETNTPATFFLVGKNIAKYPDTLKRMVEGGHQIGSHTWDHADITTLTKEKIEHEVAWTDQAIEEASGEKPSVFRPPYGNHGAVYDRLIPYPLVLWDVDTLDWKHHDPQQTVSIAMDEVRPGSVILMHDIHASSVKAVPELVTKLKDAGYTPVTVEQLFPEGMENSVAYTAGHQTKTAK